MTDATMDDDTTATSGQDDPEEVAAQAQEDVAPQASSSASGKALAGKVVNKILDNDPQNDPAQASLIAQYGLNAQQARALLKNARDTLAQNAPQMENLAAAQKMSNPGGWGNLYASSLGAASDKQQQILGQLLQYDQAGNDADRGALDARLKLMLNRNTDIAKLGPAAMRVAGAPDAATKPVTGEVGQMEALADEKGLVKGTPEYDAFVSKVIPKLTHVPPDPAAQAALLTPDAKEMNYQYFLLHNQLMPGFSRNPSMSATMLNYVSQRAAQEGNTEVGINATSQANKMQQAVYTDFMNPKGTAGSQLNAINTAVFHSQALLPLIDAMDNGDLTIINKAKQAFQRQTGQAAPNNYDELKQFLAGEYGRATIKGPGGEAERAALVKPLDSANAPDALKQAIGIGATALAGKTAAYRNQWDNAFPNHEHGDFNALLLPETRKVLGIQDQTTPPAATKVLPSGAKLDAYAQAHFGGDAAKATAFLQQQGYK